MASLIHPIRTPKYRKFLKALNWGYDRIKGDHEIWLNDDTDDEIVFITNDKDVDPFIIKQNNKTLGITDKEFLRIIHSKKNK